MRDLTRVVCIWKVVLGLTGEASAAWRQGYDEAQNVIYEACGHWCRVYTQGRQTLLDHLHRYSFINSFLRHYS